eukprot:XP_001706253.1 Hypothetical protein GL50803_3720 [Giardia lamblia ATCC 50803]
MSLSPISMKTSHWQYRRPTKQHMSWDYFELLNLYRAITFAGLSYLSGDGLPEDDLVIEQFYTLKKDYIKKFEPLAVYQMYRAQVQRTLLLGVNHDWMTSLLSIVFRLLRAEACIPHEKIMAVINNLTNHVHEYIKENAEHRISGFLERWSLSNNVLPSRCPSAHFKRTTRERI